MKKSVLMITLMTEALSVGFLAQSSVDDLLKKAQQATQSKNANGRGLSTDKITAGLKQALQISTGKAVAATGRTDGFLKNAAIKILLPEKFGTVGNGLRMAGRAAKVV